MIMMGWVALRRVVAVGCRIHVVESNEIKTGECSWLHTKVVSGLRIKVTMTGENHNGESKSGIKVTQEAKFNGLLTSSF